MRVINSLKNFKLEEVWQLVSGAQSQSVYPNGAKWSLQDLQSELDHAQVLASVVEGQLAALVFYRDTGLGVEVTWLGTSPPYQRRGLMRYLLAELANGLNHSHCLWLEVHSANEAALRLYKSMGFRLQSQRKNYYSDGGDAQLFEYKPLQ